MKSYVYKKHCKFLVLHYFSYIRYDLNVYYYLKWNHYSDTPLNTSYSIEYCNEDDDYLLEQK